MTWFFLAVSSAVTQSISDVLCKRGLRDLNEYVVSWSFCFFSFLFLLPLFIFFIDVPEIGPDFWPTVCIVCVLDAVGFACYLKAMKCSDLSMIVPLQMLTPLFLLFTSPLMLGESPSLFGLFGILLIISGSYVLNIKTQEQGFFAPFRALVSDRGAKLMIAGAAIFSISTNLHKIALLNSSPLFYSFVHQGVVALILLPVVLFCVKQGAQQVCRNAHRLVPIGFVSTLTVVFVMIAMSSGLVVYVIAIKRTSVLISICLASLLFREVGFRERLAGASIMIAGVFLTAV